MYFLWNTVLISTKHTHTPTYKPMNVKKLSQKKLTVCTISLRTSCITFCVTWLPKKKDSSKLFLARNISKGALRSNTIRQSNFRIRIWIFIVRRITLDKTFWEIDYQWKFIMQHHNGFKPNYEDGTASKQQECCNKNPTQKSENSQL